MGMVQAVGEVPMACLARAKGGLKAWSINPGASHLP